MLKNSLKRILAKSEMKKEGEWYIATCPALSPIGAQGKTKKAAMKKLREVIKIYIDGCFETIIDELLEEAEAEELK